MKKECDSMSYRSDVRIITSKKGFNILKKFTDNYLKEKKFSYGNLLDDCEIFHGNDYFKYFGWDSIKWYDDFKGYEDVTAIMEGLKYLRENNFSLRFSRIGESYDDYEEFSYESDIEEEQCFAYPTITRKFDDDYVINNMDYYNIDYYNKKVDESELTGV